MSLRQTDTERAAATESTEICHRDTEKLNSSETLWLT
jgi:hypothetical protein